MERPCPDGRTTAMAASSKLIILGLSGMTVAIIIVWLVFSMSSATISAEEVLANAQAQNTTVETYKFTMEFWQTPQVEGDPPRYETLTEATVVFNQGMYLVARGNGSYGESLLLEGKQYSRDSADGTWEEHPSSFDTSKMLTLDSIKHFQIVNDLIDAAIVGEETLRGVAVTKITGRFDLQARAQTIWGDVDEQDADSRDLSAQMSSGTEDVVVWVGVEDSLIHAFEVSASFPGVGEFLPFQYWYRVEFSHFDEPLELPFVE